MVHEDLGYASYVNEYSSGKFENARYGQRNSVCALLRACLYGKKLSLFPRKHFDRSNKVVLFIWRKFFPLTGKTSSDMNRP